MRTFVRKGFVLFATLALVGLLQPQMASAGSITITIGNHGHHGHHYGYGHKYKYKHYAKPYGHNYHFRRHKHRHHTYHKYGHHLYGKKNYGYRKPCHAVSKYVYDSYGRRSKVGGTMCYDAYGSGYVVEGSRYLIH